MKQLSVVAMTLAAGISTAVAQENENIEGYLHCSLRNLVACQNSNQLVTGVIGKSFASGSLEKKDTTNAIRNFLRNAPVLYLTGSSFSPAQTAVESFWGPGEKPVQFSTGEWFFDGFTPHDATDRAAIIFSNEGRILSVALVSTSTDEATARPNFAQYVLRVYTRDSDPKSEFLEKFQAWARKVVGNESMYPGVFPNNQLIETHLVIFENGRWITRSAP
jgi:hypothetical protein